MKKIMIVSSAPDIEAQLTTMLDNNQLPEADYSIFVELYKEEATSAGGRFSHIFTFDDMRNRQAIEEGIEMFKSCEPFDQVIAADEYSIILAAEIRERLDVPGARIADIIRFRDKVAMKECLRGSDIPTPHIYSIEQLLAEPELLPAVVKPRSYAGSKGVRILRCTDELAEIAAQMESAPPEFKEFSFESLELESYVEGDIFHIDGLIFAGEILFCTASAYCGTCLDFIEGKPLGSLSVESQAEQDAWASFAKRVHEVMELSDGAFHLECFLTPAGKRVFLEVGIRPGGGYIVPAITAGTGVDLEVGHLQCQMGIAPQLPALRRERFGWVVFPKEPITVPGKQVKSTSLPSFDGLIAPSWQWLPEKGEPFTGEFYSYRSNLGAFVFHSTESAMLERSVHHVLNGYHVEAYQV